MTHDLLEGFSLHGEPVPEVRESEQPETFQLVLDELAMTAPQPPQSAGGSKS